MEQGNQESFSVAAYGEILWDLMPSGPVLGGAPFNFAYRINSLGNRGCIISRVGNDELGQRILSRMDELSMEKEFVQIDHNHSTGQVKVTVDKGGNPDFNIVPEMAYDYIEYDKRQSELMRDADCFCFGTLIQRNDQSAAVLKRLLSNFGGEHIVLDINLRKNCFDDASIVYSIEACNILKLNEDEISEVSRVYSLKADTISDFAESIMEKSGIEYIVVTLGDKGALAYSRQAKPVYVPAYTVEVIDSCGSGDAFTAAFIDRVLRGRSTAEACLYGSALGAMVAAKSGATDPVSPEELRDFIRGRKPDRIDGRFREIMLSSYDFFE